MTPTRVNKEVYVADKINPVRETDDQAIALVERLVAENRYAAIGVKEPETGVPLVSRIGVAWSSETGLFFSASDLSIHSKCLSLDGTCSLMLGEPGKGDGLAHPRVTLIGQTKRLPNEALLRPALRACYVAQHPKSELYIDFADFGFYVVDVERANLNGGFGKAYHLERKDLAFIGG
ncbi:MAG: hypothetical protein AAF412_12445 [Pseudomonadota bacterium]